MRISDWSSDGCSSDLSVAPTNMRTIAAGCTQVMLGFLGMGLGPFLPGVLSDALEPINGTDSLGYSLILMSMLWPWAAFHFFLANRTIARDIARAEGVADLPREIGKACCREKRC